MAYMGYDGPCHDTLFNEELVYPNPFLCMVSFNFSPFSRDAGLQPALLPGFDDNLPRNLSKKTALHIACSRGNHAVVENLLKFDCKMLFCEDKQGRIPLHYTESGDIVKTLLRYEAQALKLPFPPPDGESCPSRLLDWKDQHGHTAIEFMSSVIFNQNMNDYPLRSVSDFLDPANRDWYSKRDIPYRRGYLFYGPPGTGKSSFGFFIAAKFDLDLYTLNLSRINDNDLHALFASLPERCVVLLEDVDAASLKRAGNTSSNCDSPSSSPPSPNTPIPRHKGTGVSLSTLLNVLDSVGSSEGGPVLIMTTNHIERLDAALIRPGRVDETINFQLADKVMTTQLFYFIFSEGKDMEKTDEIVKLSEDFAAKVPEREFSPTEIMSLLLEYKRSPQQAVGGVEAWVEKTRGGREKVKRTHLSMLDRNDGFSG